MKHLEKASKELNSSHINVVGNNVTIIVQDGVISEVGINGIQASEMILFLRELFASLNEDFPCRENSLTITHLDEAYHWQLRRTIERTKRGVEGKNLQ
jgi:hypothetical protein